MDKEETVIGQVKTDNKTEEKATDGTKPKQARRHRFQMKQWRACPPARSLKTFISHGRWSVMQTIF